MPRALPATLHLRSIEPAANRWRYYDMAVQPDLFGGAVLCRSWGRIGCTGQQRRNHFVDARAALEAAAALAERKARRGYCRC